MLHILTLPDAQRFLTAELKSILTSAEFWTSLEALIQIVLPLATSVHKLEENSSISNVYATWIDLERTYDPTVPSIIPVPVRTWLRGRLNERWRLIFDPIFYAAYALDPRFGPTSLNGQVFETAESLIKQVQTMFKSH